jgi:hypothetical protein
MQEKSAMQAGLKYVLKLAGLVLLAWGAHGAVHAQSDLSLTGYTPTFSDEFTNASWTPNNPKGTSKVPRLVHIGSTFWPCWWPFPS